MRLRIILADDHQIMREGLRNLLESQPGYEVVGEAADGRTVVRLAQELRPDLVIMDINMPHLDGIEATRLIHARLPEIKILALSMSSTHMAVIEILKAGASGYVLKDAAFKELLFAITTITTTAQPYLSPAIADVILKDYLPRVDDEKMVQAHLSPREHEVLILLTEGMTTKAIAQHLDINPKTVDRHRQQLMDKLGANSLTDLLKYALKNGLISLNPE